MMATADQVMTRARTSTQATGELKVVYTSSIMVRLDTRVAGALDSPPLLSRTVVVMVEVRAKEKQHTAWFTEIVKEFFYSYIEIDGIMQHDPL